MTRDPSGDPSSSGSMPLEAISAARRVLIVEDNDECRRALVHYFTERGWQVESARSLRGGLLIAARLAPHAIVSELSLPDVRGYRFAADFRRAVAQDIVLVAVTRVSPMIFDSARKAGFDDVLAKPTDLDALHRMLEAAIEARLTQ
jgi:two-component system KDP operon response regulator KdpE